MVNNYSKLSFNNQYFIRNGKPYFIHSAEMHYFRIDAKLWSKHLELIKAAGLNTVSSYVPWSLHEQTEGKFDFDGEYANNLNLTGFIKLCEEFGLNLTLKPGPYILAELAMHGIPKWFFKKYPQALATDENGKPYAVNYTCLCHQDYIKKAMLWYDAVMPLIAKNQNSAGGCISMLQVCNEVGLFQWLGGKGDYSSTFVKAYRDYLKIIYKNIGNLNKIYQSSFADFNDVNPPNGKTKSKADCIGYIDWHNFHRRFYAEYIKMLSKEIRRRKIDTPLFHNIPGWVFARAKNMGTCISMYWQLAKMCPDIILGIDHIPENISYRNFHDDKIINKFTKAVQNNAPIYIAELQAGTREANVRIYPNQMELFYKACLANGAVGMNYYMFSGGINPKGWSVYDSNFYLQTPLNAKGKTDELYPVIKNVSKILEKYGEKLCRYKEMPAQAIVFYPPYYYCEFTKPLFGGENFDDKSYLNCSIDAATLNSEIVFDSLGKLLAMDNQQFDAVELATQKNLNCYKQLWLGCTEMMDAESQQKLLDYVRKGGHLICFPTVPKMDLKGQQCRILADGLGIKSKKVLTDSDGIIKWADTDEQIHAQSRIEIFEAQKAKVIALTDDNQICCLKKSYGNGSATVFGSSFSYQAKGHKFAWQKLSLAENGNFKPEITCDNPLIITTVRKDDNQNGVVFALNYHNQQLKGKLIYPDGKNVEICLEAFDGLVLPFEQSK